MLFDILVCDYIIAGYPVQLGIEGRHLRMVRTRVQYPVRDHNPYTSGLMGGLQSYQTRQRTLHVSIIQMFPISKGDVTQQCSRTFYQAHSVLIREASFGGREPVEV